MKLRIVTAATILAMAASAAWADGGGSFTVEGKTFIMKGAIAYAHADRHAPGKVSTRIEFSERALDPKQVTSAAALSNALDAYDPNKEQPPAHVQLQFSRDAGKGAIERIYYAIPDLSTSANAMPSKYRVELTRNDDQRIEGSLRSVDEASKTARHGGYFDLHFALDLSADLDDPR